MLVGADKLAKALNLSDRRVRQLVEEGLPRAKRGKYDLEKARAWYIKYLQDQVRHRGQPTESDLNEERKRLIKAQADMQELELAKARGEVIAIVDYEHQLADVVTAARARFMRLPARVAPRLVGINSRTEVQSILAAEIRNALVQMSTQRSAT